MDSMILKYSLHFEVIFRIHSNFIHDENIKNIINKSK